MPLDAAEESPVAPADRAPDLPRPPAARLTDEQRRQFERDGFLVIPEALPPAMVQRLLAVVDRLYDQGLRETGLSETNRWEMRNCLPADDLFLELVDWPSTFPLVVDLMNWNIHLITSWLMVRAPGPPAWTGSGWHRTGGTAASELQEPHPLILMMIAYWLTDLSEPGRGALRFIPGSHRLVGPPAQAEGASDPYGAIELRAQPGDAVIFEQRLWHAGGPNTSAITRKHLFYGYGYRWLRPMDYVTMPAELLARCDPIRRQLLGDAATQLGYWLPTDADVPLRGWMKERE